MGLVDNSLELQSLPPLMRPSFGNGKSFNKSSCYSKMSASIQTVFFNIVSPKGQLPGEGGHIYELLYLRFRFIMAFVSSGKQKT